MTVFIFIYRYSLGGVETFATTLARALRKNHDVNAIIYVMIPESVYESRDRIAKNGVPVVSAYSGKLMIIFMNVLASFFSKMGFNHFRQKTLYWFFRRNLKKYKVDLVHSNYHLCDEFAHHSRLDVGIPYVVTDHGSYRTSDEYERKFEIMNSIAETSSAFIYLTDLSLKTFSNKSIQFNTNCQIKRIWNGWESKFEKSTNPKSSIFTFGMISRGEPSKGWRETIDAFILLKAHTTKTIKLILVGDGPYLEDLSKEYSSHVDISFAGSTNDPSEVVGNFDVGLLPSKYVAECMPYAVIQYLSKGIPCIVTNIGSMAEMVKSKEKVAGIIIESELEKDKMVEELHHAMDRILNDEYAYKIYCEVAKEAFSKFDVSIFSNAYLESYKHAVPEIIQH